MYLKSFLTAAVIFLITFYFSDAGKLENLIAKSHEAYGIADYSSIETMKIDGNISQMGREMPITFYLGNNNQFRIEQSMQGNEILSISDGQNAWLSQMGQVQDIPMRNATQQIQQLKFFEPPIPANDTVSKYELAGRETVDGADMYKIVMDQDSIVRSFYMGKDDYLIHKVTVDLNMEEQQTIDITYNEFKDIDGFTMPHEMIVDGMQGKTNISYNSIEINPDLPSGLFTKPESTQPAPDPGGGQGVPQGGGRK